MSKPVFQPVPAQFNFPQAEEAVLQYWAAEAIYHKSLAQRKDAPPFIFYEGPPTANGLPHPGHCLTRTVKDVFPRYQTMAGRRCERKAGWDTHGLPVEIEVCKELGIMDGGKAAIEAYGIEAFNKKCQESVFRYTKEWEELTHRLGFWVDLDQAYVTYHKEYVESVWWALKTLFDRGLLYQGHKVVWWWAQGGTALSAGEVGEGYRETDDPAITVKFKLTKESAKKLWIQTSPDRKGGVQTSLGSTNSISKETEYSPSEDRLSVAFLAWTTTPWTLSSNCALAINPEMEYVLARQTRSPEIISKEEYANPSFAINLDKDYVIFARNLGDAKGTNNYLWFLDNEYEVFRVLKGHDLFGLNYEPIFKYAEPQPIEGGKIAPTVREGSKPTPPRSASAPCLRTGLVATVRKGSEKANQENGPCENTESSYPSCLAYLITFTTYGTWLRGNDRGWSARGMFSKGKEAGDSWREKQDARKLSEEPLILNDAQRECVAKTIQEVCRHRNWTLHLQNVRTNHVHAVVTATVSPERVMNDFKSYATRRLQESGLIEEQTVWTRHGSTRYLNDKDALRAAIKYVSEGQGVDLLPEELSIGRENTEESNVGLDPSLTVGASQKPYRYWTVIPGDFVTLDQGTGIVHCAPAFGEDDYRVCKENNIGFLCFLKPDGTFDERVTDRDPNPHNPRPLAGMFCKDADKAIIHLLKNKGAVVKQDQYRHPYPFCPRAENDPLIQYARKSWFIRTQQFKDEFLQNNDQIGWQPEHIKEGRFGDFLRNNIDWALSRERYWGTPLPIWICEKTGHMEAVCSYTELLSKPGVTGTEVWENAKQANPSLNENLKIHKPYIDAITYQSPNDPAARMRRVPEVIDCWFDAGSMPFAQWGFPHQPGSKEKLAANFPADFISEALDQTRGWFYSLLAISTMLSRNFQLPNAHGQSKDQPRNAQEPSAIPYPHPFRNCICLGLLLGEDGLKLSKRKKNYKEPGYLFEKYGADALRWSLLAGQPPTTSVRFTEHGVEEALREFLIRWYNVYSFFVIYANLDGFDPGRVCMAHRSTPETTGTPMLQRVELDRWILSELQATIQQARDALDRYDPYIAANAISTFVDALSNWYVRRSRPRFWAHGWSEDKQGAYRTLYECLTTLARLAAPFAPFFAETTWQNLVHQVNPQAPASVHLADYPVADAHFLDRELMEEMALVREVVSVGLSARAAAKIKVRQPLDLVELVVADPRSQARLHRHLDLVLDELNVKRVEFTAAPEKYVSYEVRPNFKVLGPKLGKKLPLVKAALAKADGSALYQEMRTGRILLPLPDGEKVELPAHEVEVRLSAKPGFAAAQGAHVVVILATAVTPELKREGLARELIHAVQAVRKDLNLAYDAKIRVTFETADPELLQVLAEHRPTIMHEVLAETLQTDRSDDTPGREANIEGQTVMLYVSATS